MELVYTAVQDVGYDGVGLIKKKLLPELPRMTFGFVLSKEKHDFYQLLSRKLTKALAECSFIQGKQL